MRHGKAMRGSQSGRGSGGSPQSFKRSEGRPERTATARNPASILAHNHPGGIAEPSKHDESIATEIQKVLALVEISLQDHIILANNEYYSFKRNNLI